MERIKYYDYTLTPVYRQVDDAIADEIIRFWERNNAIPDPAERKRRVTDVVYTIRTNDGKLVGISSVYIGKVGEETGYFYRMFIEPSHRRPGMMRHITNSTRDYLKQLSIPNKPGNMVIVTENPKLMRPGLRRMLRSNGYVYLGKTPQQLDVWKAAL